MSVITQANVTFPAGMSRKKSKRGAREGKEERERKVIGGEQIERGRREKWELLCRVEKKTRRRTTGKDGSCGGGENRGENRGGRRRGEGGSEPGE